MLNSPSHSLQFSTPNTLVFHPSSDPWLELRTRPITLPRPLSRLSSVTLHLHRFTASIDHPLSYWTDLLSLPDLPRDTTLETTAAGLLRSFPDHVTLAHRRALESRGDLHCESITSTITFPAHDGHLVFRIPIGDPCLKALLYSETQPPSHHFAALDAAEAAFELTAIEYESGPA